MNEKQVENPKPITGSENLHLMEHAPRYLKHVGDLFSKYISIDAKVIDFGAGNGLQTQHVAAPSPNILCIEVDARCQDELQKRGYRVQESLEGVADKSVDVVVSSNCLEHISDDAAIVQQFQRILKVGGVACIYVPAHMILFSAMDRHVGHHRRYSVATLSSLFLKAGLSIERMIYVDSIGVATSFIYKCLIRQSGEPNPLFIRLYDKWVFPMSTRIDLLTQHRIGKNLYMVARKRRELEN